MNLNFSKIYTILTITFVSSCNQAKDTDATTEMSNFQLSSSAHRTILESDNIKLLENEMAQHGALKIRKLKHFNGFVSNMSLKAAEKLKLRISDLRITEDLTLQATKPDHAGGPKPNDPPADPAQQVPWGNSAMGANLSTSKGAGITVCVVDSGIDMDHKDLAANIAGGKNYIVKKGRVDSTDFDDDNGHGSHVSGTIAAIDNEIGSVGIAPSAKIFAVKVLDKRGSGYLSDVADGVLDCVDAGVHIINMSLGATTSPLMDSPLKQAVEIALSGGVKVVAAAGNEGNDIANTVPSGYTGVIAVAAVDSDGNIPSWSNYGLGLTDYTAPGVAVFSTSKDGGYNTIQGTSMAAPHVAGALAVQLSSPSTVSVEALDLGYTTSRQGAGQIEIVE